MSDISLSDRIDPFTRSMVRRKVSQLIGLAGFLPQDRHDLERDLFIRVLESLERFDPTKGHRNKFITAVVDRHAANLIRNQRAQKRDHRRVASLNVTVMTAEEGTVELAQTISQRELDARIGVERRSELELLELRLDVAEVISRLSAELADLADRLQTQTVAEIARDTGIPRSTVNHWVARLRERFEEYGYDKNS
ncbi:MAG: sigma-70 family RNA polymerase sigma factor [Pirellulales bacterium]